MILLLASLFLAHCEEEPRECTAGNFAVVVTDALGNEVPVEVGWVIQDDERRDCERTGRNVLTCRGQRVGPARLAVAANGVTVERTLDLASYSDHFGGCAVGYPGSSGYAFVHDAPKCDLAQVPSVRGELFLTPDTPADASFARVEVRSSGGSAECTQEQNRFWCPATSAVATSYVVHVDFGTTKLERMVTVSLSGCHNPDPAELRIVRSERVCPSEDRGLLQLFFMQASSLGPAEHALADRVRIRQMSSEWADCQLAPVPARPEPRPFQCPALSTTGGGFYAFSIERGGRTEQIVSRVDDDGCQVQSGPIIVTFEEARVCGDGKCGAAGQVLNTTSACTRSLPDSFGLPPCPGADPAPPTDAGVL